jgi:Pyruvate phosphate dikinase, AMP/ATP-binding domain
MRGAETSYCGVSGGRLLRRLGEPLYGRRYGRVRTLNDLARAGLPVPDGVVLTEDAHEVFLEASGVVEGVKAAAWREENPRQKASEIRSRYGSVSMEAELKREICQALIGLGAPVVTVLKDNYEKRGLKTIPDVVAAVREAWLSADGLKWQIERASVGEDIPTWPVLVQREIRPLYTGWSTVERAPIETPWVGDDLRGQKVALYDVEPFDEESPERKGITRLTLEAASALEAIPRTLWGFEGGRWYVLSTEMVEDEKSVQGWYS